MSTRKSILSKSYGGGAISRIVREDVARAAAASRGRRQASYALRRIIGNTSGTGRPLLANGRGTLGIGEVKFFDTDVTNPVVSDPYGLQLVSSATSAEPANAFAGLTVVNKVLQGATGYNRIGNKIQIKSVHLKFTVRAAGSSPGTNQMRYMVVMDRQPNGAFPLLSDILSDNISTAPGFHSGINMANRDRYVVMRNQYRSFSPAATNTYVVDEYIRCKCDTTFKASGNTIGDISSGAIYFIAFAETSASTSYVTLSDFHSRIRYLD